MFTPSFSSRSVSRLRFGLNSFAPPLNIGPWSVQLNFIEQSVTLAHLHDIAGLALTLQLHEELRAGESSRIFVSYSTDMRYQARI